MPRVIKYFQIVLIAFFAVFATGEVSARTGTDLADCYVESLETGVNALPDASLLIKEKIVADCGNLPEKHGIFRVVPTRIRTQGGDWEAPAELVSITDENGNPRTYTAALDELNHTLSWKIGDPNAKITGKNTYIVTYTVARAVRAGKDSDEFYWNLLGNFWDMEIDNFSARITFPDGINENNSRSYLYDGTGNKDGSGATSHWINGKVFEINSAKTIKPRTGITASVVFPAGIIRAYRPSALELYGNYLWLILPLLAFIVAFWLWAKYGKDPSLGKTVIPEFDIPGNLTPMQLGLLESNGVFSDKLLPAALIGLAVCKVIKIDEIKKTWTLGKNDYRLELTGSKSQVDGLSEPESTLVAEIFGGQNQITLSELKSNFYLAIPKIRRAAVKKLIADGYICSGGLSFKKAFLVVGFLIAWLAAFFMASGWIAVASFLGAGAIFIGFALVMPKRTAKGAQIYWQIQGFRLYMKTAELYRQQFNEKENIFEKFLPYAMVFGMTKLWIRKMEDIYGKKYFDNYHPGWYSGIAMANFNADSFTSQINSMSASIAQNIGTVSGAGGAGSVGGGGGGGGGGSW